EGLEVLDIEVTGPKAMRKYLLNRVMQEVEAIHEKSFKHISFEKMIPCICSKCAEQANPHFFEYSVLRRYQDNNINKIRCDINPEQEVLVLSLLEGVFPYDKSGHSKWDGVLDQLEIIRQLLENNGRIVAEIPYELEWIKELIRSGINLSRNNSEILNQIHTKVEAIPTNDPDLDRINAVLEQHLEAIFNMMPSARAIVQEWKNAQAQASASDIDARYKLKLKLSLLSILELEKEIAFAPKAMIKQLNQEWAEYRQGKRSLKQLFLEGCLAVRIITKALDLLSLLREGVQHTFWSGKLLGIVSVRLRRTRRASRFPPEADRRAMMASCLHQHISTSAH
ncbi:MAG TPA: hypothetical protein PKA32_04820, partial [Candidatus Gracilibacteria bacterium]|nr:hypothetical protein [Candidatus Gracilibacteria bacterium]